MHDDRRSINRRGLMAQRLVPTHIAARALGMAPKTLRNWRSSGTGPEFVKLGRSVRYDIDALASWRARSAALTKDERK